ncbi:facilitated trehalose transporter Tret1-2 homolog [Ctenocephalides felis]|uniref:facilitated trehalose transporter Tret1-2 homolog n=1 Tax=Ctenocephalides felis TaxID=7515 RepID=UPI000E6E525B|nr:facilitated trehalose transporter Tret1-2 homolog [Ctenocephalides felis]
MVSSFELRKLLFGGIAAKRELRNLEARVRAELIGSSAAMSTHQPPIWRQIMRPHVAKPLFILNVFNVLQILSGTYLVVFYAVDIIKELGGAEINNLAAANMTAAVRLVFTMLCCYLLLVMPRRTLAIFSGFFGGVSVFFMGLYIMFIASTPKTTVDVSVLGICTLIYIAGNTGLMVLPGVMIGELLPAKTRGVVAGYVFAFFNLSLFTVAKVFPEILTKIGSHGMFLFFGSASLLATIFIFVMLPETKGKTLGYIEDYFRQDNFFWFTRSKDTNETKESTVITVSKG